MRWDTVIPAWLAKLAADPALTAALGGSDRIYPAQSSKPVRIPSIEYVMFSDIQDEWLNLVRGQLDIFVKGEAREATIERRLRLLTHSDVAQVLGGERLWFRIPDARSLDYPADPAVQHRILDFEFEAVRDKYAHS